MTGKRLAGFILALGVSGSASAASVTWAFEGYVTLIAAEPDTGIALVSLGVVPGSSFTGRLVFESETPDEDADPTNGWYPGAISLFEITIGGYHQVVSIGSDNGIAVSMHGVVPPGPQGPRGFVRATASGPGPFGLFHDPLLMLELPGSPLYPIYGDELAFLAPPGLVEYDFDELFLAGIDGNIDGNLTSIVVVPEPATLALLAPLGLAFVALRRR